MSRFLSLFLVLTIGSFATAAILTVDANPVNQYSYRTMQAAHDASQNNDTIYVVGNAVAYGSFSISHPLTIIGPGYFLSENSETQARLQEASVNGISIGTGVSGVRIMGITLTQGINSYSSQLVIRRCKFLAIWGRSIGIYSGSNILIEQCYIMHTYTEYAIYLGGAQEVTIRNCFIETPLTSLPNYIYNEPSGGPVYFEYNTMKSLVGLTNSTFRNNIFRDGTVNAVGNHQYNVASGTQFGTSNGNQSNVDLSGAFVGATGNSTDGRWQLVSDSPLRTASIDGGQVGMFGGSNPYQLSGLPGIPAIYYLNAPATGTNPGALPVTIRAKTH